MVKPANNSKTIEASNTETFNLLSHLKTPQTKNDNKAQNHKQNTQLATKKLKP